MLKRNLFWFISLVLSSSLILVACNNSSTTTTISQDAHGDDHSMGDTMVSSNHNVPNEAAKLANPLKETNENIEAGKKIFTTTCAPCHGETGLGDGPAAAALETKPANMYESHVQELSDGALFYIISHGGQTPIMPAWENVLTEKERWQIVYYIRTFKKQ